MTAPPEARGIERVCRAVTVAVTLTLPFGAYEFAGISVVNVAIIATLVFTYVYVTFGGTFRRHNFLPFWLLGFFFAINLVATVEALNPVPHLKFMVPIAGAMAIFAMCITFVRDRRIFEWACRGLVVSAFVAVAGAAAQGMLGIGGVFPSQVDRSRIGDIPRVVGFVVTHGLFAQIVAAGGLIAFSGILPARGRRIFSRKMAVLGFAVSIVGVMFSQSRSQMVATAAGFLAFAGLSVLYLRGWHRTALVTVLVVGGIGLSIVMVPLAMALIAMSPVNVVRRFEGYDVALDLIRQYPISGVGRFGFIEMVGGEHVLHNTFLSVAVSTGIPSLAVLFALMGVATVRGIRAVLRRDDLTPLAIALLSSFAAIFVAANLYDGLNAPVYWVVMALLMNVPFIAETYEAVRGRPAEARRVPARTVAAVPEFSRGEV